MKKLKIPYREIPYFSNFFQDYMNGDVSEEFYNRAPSIDSFESQIHEKSQQDIDRELLTTVIQDQNSSIHLSEKSSKNISLLNDNNTFTITTGHQLCLFGGPLYFFYKIISTINLSISLKKRFPEYNFIPIFWMASEDHDFKEVNNIHLFNKKYKWISEEEGMVGSFKTKGIDKIIDDIKKDITDLNDLDPLINLLRSSYQCETLVESTRFFVNEIFGKYGIITLDASDTRLKRKLIPIMKKDILKNSFYPLILKDSDNFQNKYNLQAFYRKINFFRLDHQKRERIIDPPSEIEINNMPERFSPNVLMRPLYQELILPNLAYIGGGAEIAYWMQLKSSFKSSNIVFPILFLRNSVLFIENKDYLKWESLGLEIKDLFSNNDILYRKYLEKICDFDLNDEVNKIREVYVNILEKVKIINNSSMNQFVESEMKKQIKLISKIEKKHLKAMKHKHKSSIKTINKIKEKLFPENTLQERVDNIFSCYLNHEKEFIDLLFKEINVLDSNFLILFPENKE